MRQFTNNIAAVDVCIASLYRGGHVVKTIQSLIGQPQLNHIYLCCNNYTPEQLYEVRQALLRYKEVVIIERNNEKGCSEKFYPINMTTGQYICTIDDDLTVHHDFLNRLVAGAEKYDAVVSFHGRVLKPRPIGNYYRDKLTVYRCLGAVTNDVEVDVIGSGCTLFDKSLLPLSSVLYESIEHPNMSDIYLSYLAKESYVKCYVLTHDEGFIRHKVIEAGDDYIFDRHKNNCKPQTNFINEYFR